MQVRLSLPLLIGLIRGQRFQFEVRPGEVWEFVLEDESNDQNQGWQMAIEALVKAGKRIKDEREKKQK